jgi:hypothetical protein
MQVALSCWVSRRIMYPLVFEHVLHHTFLVSATKRNGITVASLQKTCIGYLRTTS